MIDIRTAIAATGLPLVPHLDRVVAALSDRRLAVLRAEAGSGKSTLVPLALAASSAFAGGRIVMLEPRRLAAVGVASRMAELLGEEAGDTVGYSVRLERRCSGRTRVEVVTEGLLTRRLLSDPAQGGVSVLIFDEFHERSIHADLALALALDLRRLRSDLAVLVMSATLDAERISSFLEETEGARVPLIECPVRPFPVEIVHRPLAGRQRLGDEVAAAVVAEIEDGEGEGDALVFLPGRREIEDAASALGRSGRVGELEVLKLHGSLPLAEQRRVVAPRQNPPRQNAPRPDGPAQGRSARKRRVILSTNIAETSLTVNGVTLVVDSGFVRLQRYHLSSAMDRLSLETASLRSADQRSGRAGRLAPGRCVRLWAERSPRPADTESEILRVDLSSLVLDCALWGVRDRLSLPWLEPPPESAWLAAVELLRSLGALDGSGGPTKRGERMAAFGLHPRLAALVLAGEERGQLRLACAAAAALSDRDGSLIRDDADFRRRLAVLRSDRNEEGGAGAAAWRERVRTMARDLMDRSGGRDGGPWSAEDEADIGSLLAAGFPDRICRRQESLVFRFPSGREARVDGPLSREEWLVACEADAGERLGVVRLCAPVGRDDAAAALRPLVAATATVEWTGLVPRAVRETRAGRLLLSAERAKVDRGGLGPALAALLGERGLGVLPWEGEGGPRSLLERIRFAPPPGGGPAARGWCPLRRA